MPLMADVAKTCPLDPIDNTTIEATTTIRSTEKTNAYVIIIVRYIFWYNGVSSFLFSPLQKKILNT